MKCRNEEEDRIAASASASDRSFGFVFAVFFALVAFWPVLHKKPLRLWAVFLSAAFLITAVAHPRTLAPLNRLWTRLGAFLGKLTNPIVAGFVFYLIFMPAGVILRLLRKDLLRLRYDKRATSYWISRERTTISGESLRNQF
jgi:Saxitoxin biosynthesis operon protein SxtJ